MLRLLRTYIYGDRDVKKLLLVFAVLMPFYANAENHNSIETMNKAVDSACKKDANYSTCRKVVLLAANFAMTNSGFYTENCIENVKPDNYETCADAKSLIIFLQSANE